MDGNVVRRLGGTLPVSDRVPGHEDSGVRIVGVAPMASAPGRPPLIGFHPLWAFCDHGAAGTGEPLAFLLLRGNAGSNTVVDHKAVITAALAQLPGGHARGKRVLVGIDGAGGTHELLAWLTRRRLSYSVGFTLPGDLASIQATLAQIPDAEWQPAYDADGQTRPGAWVAEVTDLLDLGTWPDGMRLIVRKERPHPGAQLRITDLDGLRVTAARQDHERSGLAPMTLEGPRNSRSLQRQLITAGKWPFCRAGRQAREPGRRARSR